MAQKEKKKKVKVGLRKAERKRDIWVQWKCNAIHGRPIRHISPADRAADTEVKNMKPQRARLAV